MAATLKTTKPKRNNRGHNCSSFNIEMIIYLNLIELRAVWPNFLKIFGYFGLRKCINWLSSQASKVKIPKLLGKKVGISYIILLLRKFLIFYR